MWPFTKKPKPVTLPPSAIKFSQVDISEGFGDDKQLKPGEWIKTTPINALLPDGEPSGLPARGAADEEVFAIASKLSKLRESLPIPGDGVYCPICHIASVDLNLLRTPCPKCGRELLKFGWT